MDQNDKQTLLKGLPVYLLCLSLIIVLFIVYRRHPPKRPDMTLGGSIADFINPDQTGPVSLEKLVCQARSWQRILAEWEEKHAPQLEFTDTGGNTTRLRDFAGQEIIIVFFSSWWPPSKMQIPHLNSLIEAENDDSPLIIALSDEKLDTLRAFTAENDISYKVGRFTAPLVEPYNRPPGLPASFYIDKTGKITLIALGIVTAPESKSIISFQKNQP